MKRRKKMHIVLSVVILLIVIMLAGLYIPNMKPQVPIGLKEGKFQEISEKPNCVSTQTMYSDKEVDVLPFKETLDQTHRAILSALNDYGNIKIIEDTGTYIYAVATTSLMRYKDDIEIYFDEEEEVIHYRSSSRTGYSDMGLNRERYERIVDFYNK